MALTVATYLWGAKYSVEYPVRLASAVRRNVKQPFRMVLVTDQDQPVRAAQGFDEVWPIPQMDLALLQIPGCYARLRMFDPVWQRAHDIKDDDRLVSIDLDTVVAGGLDPLFDRPEPFVIMQGGNYSNPCPYNGALIMVRGGAHPEAWTEFSIAAAAKAPFHEFPDDQGWLAYRVPGAAGWKCGRESGVYVFRKPGWPDNDRMPDGTRLVTFSGWRSPEKFKHAGWVRKNWR